MVEKPIATSEKDCKELISLAKKNKLVLLVGHIERFNPVITKLKSIIDKFKVRIINIERLSFVNTRNQDIDTVQDLMIHDIDLLNFLIKSKIHRIETMGFISKKLFRNMHVLLSNLKIKYSDNFLLAELQRIVLEECK